MKTRIIKTVDGKGKDMYQIFTDIEIMSDEELRNVGECVATGFSTLADAQTAQKAIQ